MPIDKKALARLLRQPTFTPTDCPNYITYKDYEQYRWYARVLAPLLLLCRGTPLFVGKRTDTLHGTANCDTWMVVRYPTHRHMLAMVMNPYYPLVANRFREKGTAALELGFTQPRDPDSGLQRHADALGLHVATSEADTFFKRVRALAAPAKLTVVYESEWRMGLDFITAPRAKDPNPLTYPTTAVVAGGSAAALRAFAQAASTVKLLEAQDRACVNLYERAPKYEMIRFGKTGDRSA